MGERPHHGASDRRWPPGPSKVVITPHRGDNRRMMPMAAMGHNRET